MIDRLGHHAEILSLKGDSHRLKNHDLVPGQSHPVRTNRLTPPQHHASALQPQRVNSQPALRGSILDRP